MESIDLYREIDRVLPQENFIQVMSALRIDPLVWQSLQQPKFLQSALDRAGAQADRWSPGQLSLMMLTDTRPEKLREEPLVPLEHVLQEKSLRAYQSAQRNVTHPETLSEAGLLALALRERRRLTGTWNGLLQEIMPKPSQAETLFPVWRTALACLYALSPDPIEMLRGLMPKSPNRVALDWITFTQMAQPLSQEDHLISFTQVLKGFQVSTQLSVLRNISLHGHEYLAGLVADRLLIGHPAFSNLRIHNPMNDLDLSNLSSRALALQQLGTFYQLAGDQTQAISLFGAAAEAIQQWLSSIYLQCMNVQAVGGREDTNALIDGQELSRLASSAGWLKDDLGVVLVSHPYASCVLDQVNDESESPFLSMKRASLLFDEQPALARDLARQASQALIEQMKQHGIPFRGEHVYSWRPQDAIELLLDLGLADEALVFARAMLNSRPTDVALLHQTAQILERLGQIKQALTCEYASVMLDPQNLMWRRALAALWGKAGDWIRSLEEWKLVFSLSEKPETHDQVACAQAALNAGLLDEACDMSRTVLNMDPNNGIALGILGQATLEKGDPEHAVAHLVRATLLSPDTLTSWLALAKAQNELGETHRAVETLRAGAAALPESPQVHLALGMACCEAGLLAEGLPSYKRAYQLAPNDQQAVLSYANVLRRLGYLSEARTLLEGMREAIQTNPAIAYEYAQVLLDLNEIDESIPVLELALRNGLSVLDGYLLYARVLLGQYNRKDEMISAIDTVVSGTVLVRIQQAEQVLQKVLSMDPDNLEALFLCADILREKGNYEEALDGYRDLAGRLTSGSQELSWRVQWGIARTALRLDRIDTALAAFKEACQVKPDSLLLRRGLAEASLQAGLHQEAMSVADQVLQMESDDVNNLAWYADFVSHLGENEKAVAALERAVQIDPFRPDLLVDLAQWQMSAGDLGAASKTLETVLSIQHYREGLRGNFLRRAAQMYLRMQDLQSALTCYDRALAAEAAPDSSLYYEIAELHERLGNLETALDLIQRAQEINPESLPVILLQSDLLSRLERPQAAMALLERALRVIKHSEEQIDHLSQLQKDQLVEIHERFMNLMLEEGNIPSALFHAEQAFSLIPGSTRMAYRAADLAMSIIQMDQAQQILSLAMPQGSNLAGAMLEQGSDGLDLLCMFIETALVEDRLQDAQTWLDNGLELAPHFSRLMAAEARILARQGELREAEQIYAEMIAMIKQGHLSDLENPALWLVETALEVRMWEDALAFSANYAAAHPIEARASLLYAKTLVLAAEHQRLCSEIGCVKKSPGIRVLDEEHQELFTEAIQSASRLSSAGVIGRWQARGLAVFAPSSQSIRVLAAMPVAPDDVAALIAALRQFNNRSAAMQLSRRFPNDGGVLMQLALCYLNEDSLEGLAIAEQAVHARPGDPLAHAIMARLAVKASALGRAIEAYTKALELDPVEPEWHDAAGDLFLQIGKTQQALWHRQQALDQAPGQARYAQKLGQVCLANGDSSSAVEYLERSTVLDTQQADAWLALANAYHISGRLPQAIEAAKQAGILNPSSAEGLLIAGEIALSMNQIEQAYDLARNAVRREPENTSAILFLSNVLTLQNKESESLALLESAPAQVKSVYPVAIERARLIHKVHGPQVAIEVLEKLVKDYPEESDLISLIARTEAECGDLKAAERYAFKALRLDPNQPDLSLMLGKLQRKSGQLDQAVHLLSEVIRLSPDSMEAYLELASVYQERREFGQALQVYRQAMRVAPDDYQAYYQSGLIMRDSKDYIGAEAMLRKAADLAPDNLGIRRQLVGVIALNLVHNKQEVTVQ